MTDFKPALELKPFHRTLAAALFEAQQDPRMYVHVDDAPPTDFANFQKRCERLENTISPNGTQRWLNWAVFVDGVCAGFVQSTIHRSGMQAEIAYMLNSAFHGRGVGYAATSQMMGLLQKDFGVREMWMTIFHTNQRSIALAFRLGFEEISASEYHFDNFEEGDRVFRWRASD